MEVLEHHISEFLTPDTWAFFQDCIWPELHRAGKVENVPSTMVTKAGALLPVKARSEVLRDSTGAFLRTFARLTVLPGIHRLAAACCTTFAIARLEVMGLVQ